MNKDELQGGARYLGGKVEKAVGDAVDSNDLKVDGVVDQVAGGVQHTYGRARSVADDVQDSIPALTTKARAGLEDAADRAADVARDGAGKAARIVRNAPAVALLVSAIGGYALSWLVHGRRN